MATIPEMLMSAVQHHQSGRLAPAEQLYRQIITADPKQADAWHLLGVIGSQLGQHTPALECIQRAIALHPSSASFYSNLGNVLHALGRDPESIAAYQQALQIDPQFVDAYMNLAGLYKDQKKYDAAETALQQALRLNPGYAVADNNLGVVYRDQGRLEAAIECYHRALAKNPHYADAHNNLGNALHDLGQFEASITCYQEAVRLKPDYAEAHLSLAISWLLVGNMEAGWPEYDWRFACKRPERPPFVEPIWDGSPLDGKTILLYGEQGFGDKLQFIRYAPLVKARGGRVVVACNPALMKIFSRSPGIDVLVPIPDGELPQFDVYANLMTLPAIFQTRMETIPCEVPYLFADPDLVAHWREKLGVSSTFKVGIIWQGSQHNFGARTRTLALKQFAPLAEVPGVEFVSLQKGFGTEQLAEMAGKMEIIELGDQFDGASGAFMDSAAVMQNLDLVISADTSIGHLAGGLRVPVWVAIPFVPDWRWLRDREDSPWYPTMRLFRQPRTGDWESVFRRMADELRHLVTAKLNGPASPAAGGSGSILVETALGEIADKITILEIKSARIEDPSKLVNVRRELMTLSDAFAPIREAADRNTRAELDDLVGKLKSVNEALWQIEDDIRDCEHEQNFGPQFVELARSVYRQNDKRAALKRQINALLGSRLVEEKSYRDYEQSEPTR